MFQEYRFIAGVPQKKHPHNMSWCRQIARSITDLSLTSSVTQNRFKRDQQIYLLYLSTLMGNSLLHQPMEKTATYLDRRFGCCPLGHQS